MRSPALRAVVALAFANGLADAAFSPLLPGVRDDLGLSPLATGAALSATTFAMLATAVPIGMLTGRVGAGRLLTIAAVLLPLSLAAQALAHGLEPLLLARAAFGVSFGILWVVGPATAAAGGRGASGTGRLIAASGCGWLVGPVLAGVLADAVGWRAALAVLAVTTVPAALVVARSGAGTAPLAQVRLRSALAGARRRSAAGATLVSGLLGVITGVTGLLAPLVLADRGLSAAAIGAVVAAGAVVWIVSAAVIGRMSASVVRLRTIGAIVVVLALIWLLPAFSLSAAALVTFLVLSAGCRASVNALVYAVGARAAANEDGAAALIGVMNLVWACAALAAPLLAGAAGTGEGVRVAFAVTAAVTLAVGAMLLAPARLVRLAS